MKSDRRVKKTKKAIKDALLALVMEDHPPKITITAVAKKADIDRKTFYLHYDSVNDVVREMSRERLASFQSSINQADYLSGPINVAALFTMLNDSMEEELDIYRHIARNPEYSFFWHEIGVAVKETFIATYAKTLNISEKELQICAEYFTSATTTLYIKWLNDEIDLTLEELVETMAGLSTYGLQKYFKEMS